MSKNYICVDNRLDIYDDSKKLSYSAKVVCRHGQYVLTRRSNGYFDFYRLDVQTATAVLEWLKNGKYISGVWELWRYDECYKMSVNGEVTCWGRFVSGHFEAKQGNGNLLIRYYDAAENLSSFEAQTVWDGVNAQAPYETHVVFKISNTMYRLFNVVANGSALQPIEKPWTIFPLNGLTLRFIASETVGIFRAEVVEIENEVAALERELNLIISRRLAVGCA